MEFAITESSNAVLDNHEALACVHLQFFLQTDLVSIQNTASAVLVKETVFIQSDQVAQLGLKEQ